MKDEQPVEPPANPVEFADIAIKPAPGSGPTQANPIMAAPTPTDQAAQKEQKLDKDLKEASQEVKKVDNKPHNPNSKPLLAIFMAVVVAIGLSAAAYLAFKKG